MKYLYPTMLHWNPLSLLYNFNRIFFLLVKRSGHVFNQIPLFRDEIKEIVELYIYSKLGHHGPYRKKFVFINVQHFIASLEVIICII